MGKSLVSCFLTSGVVVIVFAPLIKTMLLSSIQHITQACMHVKTDSAMKINNKNMTYGSYGHVIAPKQVTVGKLPSLNPCLQYCVLHLITFLVRSAPHLVTKL